jgi:hypothetical protein
MAQPCFAWTAGTHASRNNRYRESIAQRQQRPALCHQKSLPKLAWIPLYSGMTLRIGCDLPHGGVSPNPHLLPRAGSILRIRVR